MGSGLRLTLRERISTGFRRFGGTLNVLEMGVSPVSDSVRVPAIERNLGDSPGGQKKTVGRFAVITGLKHAQTAVATPRDVAPDVAVVGCTLRAE